jgi:hypothetical protein
MYLGIGMSAIAFALTAFGHSHSKSELKSWWSSIEPHVTAFSSAGDAKTAVQRTGNLPASRAACEKFAGAARTLQADRPAPNAKVDALWQTVLADAAKSGSECATAIATNNPALMDQSTRDLVASDSALDQMTAQIK